jgi:hypothetical protein
MTVPFKRIFLLPEEKAYGMTVTMIKIVKRRISTVGIINFIS